MSGFLVISMDGCMDAKSWIIDPWMDGWMTGAWIDGCMGAQMSGWMN